MKSLRKLITTFDWSLISILKLAIGIVALVVTLAIVVTVLRFTFVGVGGFDQLAQKTAPAEYMLSNMGFGGADSTSTLGRGSAIAIDRAVAESGIVPSPHRGGGDDAEEYERRSYTARYETRNFEETCTAVSELKPLEYVVFDNSSQDNDWCRYSFRVDIAYEDEIVNKLRALNPDEFRSNIDTIERSIEYHDSELSIQERRLTTLQDTLAQAEQSFDSLIARATREGDTATLSEVINNKISTLERIEQQILNTQERIDRLTRGRSQQIDQIEYAHVQVTVSRVAFFDGDKLGEQWRERVQQLVEQVNATLLGLTVGLLAFVLHAIEFVVLAALTLGILVVFARIMWTFATRVWRWSPRSKQ